MRAIREPDKRGCDLDLLPVRPYSAQTGPRLQLPGWSLATVIYWLDEQRRRMRVATRNWLRAHPRAHAWLRSSGCMEVDDGALPRGVAIGLGITLLPLLGAQLLLMIGVCMLLRANFPIAFAVSWVGNPLTWGPLWWSYHLIGERLFGPLLRAMLSIGGQDPAWLEAVFVGLGSLFVAIPAAALGYMAARALETRLKARRRPLRRPPPG